MQFSQVIGQKELKHHLITEVKKDKISHAQLFLGKPGYGTLPLAIAFAQYVLCENKGENDSCGTCNSCRKVEKLQHADLHFTFPVVQKETQISDGELETWRNQIETTPYFSQDQWRNRLAGKTAPIISAKESENIIKKLSLRSFEGGYKILIVWGVEVMNTSCSNKLLKIIEEPPANTLIILVSEDQEKILQTILSRTQIVKVPRISLGELSAYITQKFGVSSMDADSLASRAEGSLLEVLEHLGDHEASDRNRDLFINLMRVCYKKDVNKMMDWSEDASTLSKNDQQVFLRYALHMFRQSMLRNYTEDHLTKVSQEEDSFLQNFARFITGNNIHDFMDTFDQAHYHIDRNANAKLLFMNLCFQVMRYIHVA